MPTPSAPHATHYTAPVSQVQVPANSAQDTPSVITGTAPPGTRTPAHTTSMAMVTPSPSVPGTTTSTHMDSGPNTLLRQLMSNASAQSSRVPNHDGQSVTTSFQGQQYQVRRITHITYRVSEQHRQVAYTGALVDSGANGGMAGSDTRVLSIVPHAHVDITGVGGDVMEWLPLIQCASMVETIDEGKIVLIMSQYAHKPDAKTIHSKSQVEHFGGMVYDSAMGAGGHQMVVTHEGYAIPLHVRNGLYYMDMSPATDNDLDLFPHIFLTADAPCNPDIVDEEFFHDASESIVDLPIIQTRRDGRDPIVDSFGNLNSLILAPSDSPITQECHEVALDTLSIMSQMMKRRLPDLDALLPNFGWMGKERIRDTLAKTTNITRPISGCLCGNTSSRGSQPPMSDVCLNGTRPTLLFRICQLLMMAFPAMVVANSFKFTVAWILSYFLLTQCLLSMNSPIPSVTLFMNMGLWRASNLTMPSRKHHLP